MSDNSTSGSDQQFEDEAIDQIRTIRETFERVEAEGDFGPMLDFVAEDFVFLPPGSDATHGRDTFAAKFNEGMADAPSRNYQIFYESE